MGSQFRCPIRGGVAPVNGGIISPSLGKVNEAVEFPEKARNKQTNKKPMINKRKSKHKYKKGKSEETARNISIILFLCSQFCLLIPNPPSSGSQPTSYCSLSLINRTGTKQTTREQANREALKFRGPEEHEVTRNTDTSEPQDSSKLDSFKSRHLNFV